MLRVEPKQMGRFATDAQTTPQPGRTSRAVRVAGVHDYGAHMSLGGAQVLATNLYGRGDHAISGEYSGCGRAWNGLDECEIQIAALLDARANR